MRLYKLCILHVQRFINNEQTNYTKANSYTITLATEFLLPIDYFSGPRSALGLLCVCSREKFQTK